MDGGDGFVCVVFFDDDGKVYIAYGNRNVYVAELNEDLTATVDADDESKYDPSDKRCSYGKLVVRDRDDAQLGYEGSHFYKINGKYYLFFIHMPRATGKRTESCFVSDVPMGEYIGYDVCDDDMGFHNSGAAQGGIVDTPSGKWYAMLFQDSGAVGRLPVLIPVTWKDDMPVFGDDGKMRKCEVEDGESGLRCEYRNPNLETTHYSFTPVSVFKGEAPSEGEYLSDAQLLAVGDLFACAAIGEEKAVYCWGRGSSGQLGNGKRADQDRPVAVCGEGYDCHRFHLHRFSD